jgi:type IV secretory pathway VirB2 component (pilin)
MLCVSGSALSSDQVPCCNPCQPVTGPVAKCAAVMPVFALAISTRLLMLQMRTEFANANRRYPMRSIVQIVLPIIAAASISGLMFTATLA